MFIRSDWHTQRGVLYLNEGNQRSIQQRYLVYRYEEVLVFVGFNVPCFHFAVGLFS